MLSFSRVLKGEADWKDAAPLQQAERDIWELFQFRAVREPGKDAQGGEGWQDSRRQWKREMDYIIIDCSPAAVSADAEVWVSVADSVLLVVREDWADVRVINDAVDMISQTRDGLCRDLC